MHCCMLSLSKQPGFKWQSEMFEGHSGGRESKENNHEAGHAFTYVFVAHGQTDRHIEMHGFSAAEVLRCACRWHAKEHN